MKIIKTENSFKEIINSIDNSENHINFVYNNVKPKFKKPDSFYNGMLSCNLNKINLKKNSFLNLITINSLQQEENLSISIDNNSKSDWNINDFTLKNPVTIRSIIFDKNNNSFPGPSLTDFYFYVKKGQSTSFNVNYLKFNEMVKQIKKVKEAKYLMIDLVHEGKIYFHQKKFLPCKINIT